MLEFETNLLFESKKSFIQIYESNSFNKTADSLDVSLPAISASIKRRGEYLGYSLYL